MNRTIIFSIVFILMSMGCMNLILQVRERQLLSESGKTVVESPVRDWQEWEVQTTEREEHQEAILTIRQMMDAINSWNYRLEVVLHEPVEGQISMSEAIEAGKAWLKAMDVGECGNFVQATLSVEAPRENMRTQFETYYSIWSVQFRGYGLATNLYINAVTGTVWGAEILFYEELSEELQIERLQRFWELAGFKSNEKDSIKREAESMRATYLAEDNPICAQMEVQQLTVTESGKEYYGVEEFSYRECVIVSYRLQVDNDRIYNYNTTF